MILRSLSPNLPDIVTLPTPAATRILVVGADEFTGALLAESFEAPGFQTAIAADLPEALRQNHRFRPDVIVLDATSPGLGHTDFAEWSRLDGQTDATPIVALTTRDQLREVVARDGVWVCLVKPIDTDVLVGAVQRIAGFCHPSNTH